MNIVEKRPLVSSDTPTYGVAAVAGTMTRQLTNRQTRISEHRKPAAHDMHINKCCAIHGCKFNMGNCCSLESLGHQAKYECDECKVEVLAINTALALKEQELTNWSI